jgi:hypothetical protein
MSTCLAGGTVHKGRCEDRKPPTHGDVAFGLLLGVAAAAGVSGPEERPRRGLPATGFLTGSPLPGCSHWRTRAIRLRPGIRPLAGLGSTGRARRWRLASRVSSSSPVGGSGASMSAPKRRPLRCEQKGSHGAARCARLPDLEPSWPVQKRSDPPCTARVPLIWDIASGRAAASGAGRRWRTRCCCSARLAPGRARSVVIPMILDAPGRGRHDLDPT